MTRKTLRAVGGRIQVVGNSGSGKSTLGKRLAEALEVDFVELDALNWLPGWVGLNQTDPDRFERWLDLPLPLLVWRFLRRSWRRSRSGELVWGTNREWFWRHLLIWRDDSLLGWIITQHRRKRRNMAARVSDPRWAHIRIVRLTSPREVEDFAASVGRKIRAAD